MLIVLTRLGPRTLFAKQIQEFFAFVFACLQTATLFFLLSRGGDVLSCLPCFSFDAGDMHRVDPFTRTSQN